jgi:hypothetical protein
MGPATGRPWSGVAAAPHCGEISARPVYRRNALECWCGEQRGYYAQSLGELAGTYCVNLILAAVSVVATYGGLNLALVTGRALLH